MSFNIMKFFLRLGDLYVQRNEKKKAAAFKFGML